MTQTVGLIRGKPSIIDPDDFKDVDLLHHQMQLDFTPLQVLDLAFPPDRLAPAMEQAENQVLLAAQIYRLRVKREAEWRGEFGDEAAERIINA